MSGFGYIDFVSIWNKQISRYPMIWIGKNNDMKDIYENCSFSWKNPAPPAEKPLYYMIEKKEDTQVIVMVTIERSWWWFLMVMIVRIFYHKTSQELRMLSRSPSDCRSLLLNLNLNLNRCLSSDCSDCSAIVVLL